MFQSHQFYAMGCQQQLIVEGSPDQSPASLALAVQQITHWKASLSRFRADSELNQLNQRAGTGWVVVSATLWMALRVAVWAARFSDGLVSPTVLPALEAAGYDRDFAAVLDQPATDTTAAPVADWRAIQFDRQRRAVLLPADMRLDLAGTVKGWAADRIARQLGRDGAALVDLGGDIAVSGPQADGTPWPIALADPTDPSAELDLVMLSKGGIATSGRDWRRWQQGTHERHHIIDPRTGAPAATDLLSVTIIGPSALRAEVAAKQVLILGRKAGLRWLLAHPVLAGLLVDQEGLVIRTANFEPYRYQA
ncbi:MAG: FAD:protein FMN transferase [Oscillochloridaceae bacterium umkhey_bin13]